MYANFNSTPSHTVSKVRCRKATLASAVHSCWWGAVGVQACHGAAPPWVADQTLQLGGALPIGPESLRQGGFELFQGVEDRVGEDPAQGLEPALRRVEFGAVAARSRTLGLRLLSDLFQIYHVIPG